MNWCRPVWEIWAWQFVHARAHPNLYSWLSLFHFPDHYEWHGTIIGGTASWTASVSRKLPKHRETSRAHSQTHRRTAEMANMEKSVLCMVTCYAHNSCPHFHWAGAAASETQLASRKTVSILQKKGRNMGLPINVPFSEDQDAFKLPKNLKDLQRLNAILSDYIDEHFVNVYVTYFITYI